MGAVPFGGVTSCADDHADPVQRLITVLGIDAGGALPSALTPAQGIVDGGGTRAGGAGLMVTPAGGVTGVVDPTAPFAGGGGREPPGGGGTESEGAGGARPGVTHKGTMLAVFATYSAWPVAGSVSSEAADRSRFVAPDSGPPAPVSFHELPFQTQVDAGAGVYPGQIVPIGSEVGTWRRQGAPNAGCNAPPEVTRTTLPAAVSVARRVNADTGGWTPVALFQSAPSHSQVCAGGGLTVAGSADEIEPVGMETVTSTMSWLAGSYAIGPTTVAGGLWTGCCSVHDAPSHVHVSWSGPLAPMPPKRTMDPVLVSKAIAPPALGEGGAAVVPAGPPTEARIPKYAPKPPATSATATTPASGAAHDRVGRNSRPWRSRQRSTPAGAVTPSKASATCRSGGVRSLMTSNLVPHLGQCATRRHPGGVFFHTGHRSDVRVAETRGDAQSD